MSIAIDVNMYLLCSLFNISAKKIATDYQGKSIEEIMEAEAAQGNADAAKFDKAILNDPVKLIELFQLKDPANKFAILRNMNEQDLEDLLPLLQKEDLVVGLNYFTKDKLLAMAEDLPKEQLVNMAFEMFSQEQLLQFMPESQLDKAFKSTDMDKGLEIKYLQTLKPEILAQMLEAVTGQPAIGNGNIGLDGAQKGLDGSALASQIVALPDDKFQEAMLNIPTQNKRLFMLKLAKDDPKIFQMFDSEAYINIINQRKEKQDIVKSAKVIEPEQLIKMIQQLPQDLTAAVATQIDTKKFADVLISNFKDILRQIVAA